MTDKPVRIIKHEAVPGCGSFEVRTDPPAAPTSISRTSRAAGYGPSRLTGDRQEAGAGVRAVGLLNIAPRLHAAIQALRSDDS
jgi:hypothetical protein